MSNYSYPIQDDWTKDEMIAVVDFLTKVEAAYESGISRDEFTHHYQKFKHVVNSISGEKQMDKAFQQTSGYSIYQVVKYLKQHPDSQHIRMT